jgi:hypothetical protein
VTIKLKCKGGDISEKVVMKQEMKLKQRANKWENGSFVLFFATDRLRGS